MIIKELLSEVLNKEISEISIIGKNVNYVVSNYETEENGELVYIDLGTNINIYELAHKCKEWAVKKGYEIVVLAYMIRIYKNGYEVYYTNTTLFDLDMFFKACEWILKEGN